MNYDSRVANFGIYHRGALDSMIRIQSSLQFFPSMVKWVGFHRTTIAVNHAPRPRGKSSYNFGKKLRLSINIMAAYSDKLLRLMIGFGLLVSLMAFFFAIWIIYRAMTGMIPVLGYASLMVSILFFSGVILMALGILGLYMRIIFESTKGKPSYLIRKKINDSVQ